MTLPSSGTISMSQVDVELGYSSSATISLNDTAVRTLFGKSSGTISMSDGYGKSSGFTVNVVDSGDVDYNIYVFDSGTHGGARGSISPTGTYQGWAFSTYGEFAIYRDAGASGTKHYSDPFVTNLAMTGTNTGFYALTLSRQMTDGPAFLNTSYTSFSFTGSPFTFTLN